MPDLYRSFSHRSFMRITESWTYPFRSGTKKIFTSRTVHTGLVCHRRSSWTGAKLIIGRVMVGVVGEINCIIVVNRQYLRCFICFNLHHSSAQYNQFVHTDVLLVPANLDIFLEWRRRQIYIQCIIAPVASTPGTNTGKKFPNKPLVFLFPLTEFFCNLINGVGALQFLVAICLRRVLQVITEVLHQK